jgi:DNA-binding transcriptional LysR family regulator
MADFEWYRSFVAVHQQGTVSAAAEKRQMTQPGISQHIAALERSLDTKLFTRTPRRMQPTAEGQRLYTQVIGAVEQLDRVSDPAARQIENQPMTVRLGAPREFFYHHGLEQLREEAPFHHLHLTTGETADLLRRLEAGELDAIIATQRQSQRALHYEPMGGETFILVGPPGQTLPPDLTTLTQIAGWLESQRWISYGPDLPIIRRYWQAVFARRPNLVPWLMLPDLLMILRAVSFGLGFSILPEYLCREALAQGQVEQPWQPASEPDNHIYLACPRDRRYSPEISWLAEWLAPLA